MKVTKKDIGRFVRIKYDDIGASDGIVVDVNDGRVKYFSLAEREITDNNGAPVIALGKYVQATGSGL